MALPVALYLPNILGYARILLAFWGLYKSFFDPVEAVLLFILSASLDLFDGILARALNQTSAFGVLVDIAADNILRTCGWMAAALDPEASPSLKLVSAGVICLEWITMLSTQLHANISQQHWKAQRENDPILVRALFANGFKNPIGALSMYGLFSSYLWAYGAHHAQLYERIPMYELLQYTAYIGRVLSIFVELYMVKSYLSLVIDRDAKTT